MRGPKPKRLTDAEVKRLRAAERRIEAEQLRWAKLVRELGISACAREMGITPQALHGRVVKIEGRN